MVKTSRRELFITSDNSNIALSIRLAYVPTYISRTYYNVLHYYSLNVKQISRRQYFCIIISSPLVSDDDERVYERRAQSWTTCHSSAFYSTLTMYKNVTRTFRDEEFLLRRSCVWDAWREVRRYEQSECFYTYKCIKGEELANHSASSLRVDIKHSTWYSISV